MSWHPIIKLTPGNISQGNKPPRERRSRSRRRRGKEEWMDGWMEREKERAITQE
jgi:hypothetical protein